MNEKTRKKPIWKQEVWRNPIDFKWCLERAGVMIFFDRIEETEHHYNLKAFDTKDPLKEHTVACLWKSRNRIECQEENQIEKTT